MTEEQHQFIEDFGQLMVGWGLPRTTGRVYAYLLLQSEPSSLDEIVAALEVAKSGASVAARQLVQLGMARASGERGSRRVRFEALFEVEAIFAARNAQLRVFLDRLRQGARAASHAGSRERLDEMAQTVQDFMDEVLPLMRRLRDRREG